MLLLLIKMGWNDLQGLEKSTRNSLHLDSFIAANHQTAILSQSHPHNVVKDLGRSWTTTQTEWYRPCISTGHQRQTLLNRLS